jgi:hypothetical protein
LLAETGCGPLTAAILIGQTAGAERFKSDAHFARLAGVAPIPVSSGRTDRHRLDRGGNRQLNRALHVIAITRGCSACSDGNPRERFCRASRRSWTQEAGRDEQRDASAFRSVGVMVGPYARSTGSPVREAQKTAREFG